MRKYLKEHSLPSLWQTCKALRPWAFFCETTVYAILKHIHVGLQMSLPCSVIQGLKYSDTQCTTCIRVAAETLNCLHTLLEPHQFVHFATICCQLTVCTGIFVQQTLSQPGSPTHTSPQTPPRPTLFHQNPPTDTFQHPPTYTCLKSFW